MRDQHPHWRTLLFGGHNILFYGFGCKRQAAAVRARSSRNGFTCFAGVCCERGGYVSAVRSRRTRADGDRAMHPRGHHASGTMVSTTTRIPLRLRCSHSCLVPLAVIDRSWKARCPWSRLSRRL